MATQLFGKLLHMNRCLLSITRALWWTILLDMTRRYIPQQECRMHLPISWNCTAMHHYALWIVGVCFVYSDCHVFCYWRGAATAGTLAIALGTANVFATLLAVPAILASLNTTEIGIAIACATDWNPRRRTATVTTASIFASATSADGPYMGQ